MRIAVVFHIASEPDKAKNLPSIFSQRIYVNSTKIRIYYNKIETGV